MKRPSSPRETMVSHVPFQRCFFLKNDFTIFRIIEKKFCTGKVTAQILNHPELIKKFDFNEVVYELTGDDLSVITLLLKGYNSN